MKKLLKKLFPKFYKGEDKLFTMWKSTIDMKLKPQHLPFITPQPLFFLKTNEELEYESALEKRRNTFFLLRIFMKKPVLKQPDMINCRCSTPETLIEE